MEQNVNTPSGGQTTLQEDTNSMPGTIFENETLEQPHFTPEVNTGNTQPAKESLIGNQPPLTDIEVERLKAEIRKPPVQKPNDQIEQVLSNSTSNEVVKQAERVVSITVDHAKEYRNITITLKPVPRGNFRLGLESTPERMMSVPGATFRYAPKMVGNMYRTGLNRPEMGKTPEEKKQRLAWLELQLGRTLDASYYNDMSIQLDRNTKSGEKLHLDQAFDFVVYLTMLESEQISNGIGEYSGGKKPFAEFYIENREAEAEAKAGARQQSLTIITEFGKISEFKKQSLATMAGVEVLGLSPLGVANELWGWLEAEDKPKEKPARQKMFLEWLALGDTFINVSAIVKNAIKYAILRKNAAGDYYYGDDMLGMTELEVVQKVMRPEKQDLRTGIDTKVKMKLGLL